MASGYPDGGRKAVAPIDLGILPGAGSLRSTAQDLLVFIQAQITPTGTPLGSAFSLVQQAQRAAAFSPVLSSGQIGLTLDIETDPNGEVFYQKDGATGGFSSYILYNKSAGVGIVLLASNPNLPPLLITSHQIFDAVVNAKP
jgi:CubicO group peptidase (beta-lactamase class C family)